MKKISLILLLFGSFQAKAFEAKCSYNWDIVNDPILLRSENHLVVYSRTVYSCEIGESSQFLDARITSVGPGLQFNALEDLIIVCPLVSENRLMKRIEKRGSWRVAGAGVSAALFYGGKAGVGINHRGAVCFIAGTSAISLGGAAATTEIAFGESGHWR